MPWRPSALYFARWAHQSSGRWCRRRRRTGPLAPSMRVAAVPGRPDIMAHLRGGDCDQNSVSSFSSLVRLHGRRLRLRAVGWATYRSDSPAMGRAGRNTAGRATRLRDAPQHHRGSARDTRRTNAADPGHAGFRAQGILLCGYALRYAAGWSEATLNSTGALDASRALAASFIDTLEGRMNVVCRLWTVTQ